VRPSILFVPEPSESRQKELEELGVSCVTLAQQELAHQVDLVLVAPDKLGRDVTELCRGFADSHPGVPVVVVGDAGLASAIAAMRAGAADYVESSAPATEIAAIAHRLMSELAIVRSLSRAGAGGATTGDLIGNSPKLRELQNCVAQLALSDVAVLITGETGTGKELIANLLHSSGAAASGPFVVVACSAIPAALAESELFGHVKGAFSGAIAAHRGLVRAAEGGTLFLDDVKSLSLDLQAKLLRVLQERSVRPIGSSLEVPTNFRLIAASSVPLPELVKQGLFREDLYYRLAVVEVTVPPLREREHDVIMLAERFLAEAAQRSGGAPRTLSKAAARALLAYSWPGNVRELRNALDYAITVAEYDHLSESDLPEAVQGRRVNLGDAQRDDARWSAVERQHIEAVLRSVDGNRAQAARLLGIDRRTLHRKLDRLAIDVPTRGRSATGSDSSTK